MRRWLVTTALTLILALGLMAAFASPAHANSVGTSGQPNQSCEEQPVGPSGFDTSGFDHATQVYAGSDGSASALNSNSSKSVSQYDVACFQLSSH